MARQKNSLTKYLVADRVETGEPDYKRLAKWISNVTDESEEETEDLGFYDGDGTPETDVISVKKTYTFEGMFDEEDEAMVFVASKEFETGQGRKILMKQERTDGTVLEGPATITDIKVTGGEATEYATFACSISWDKKPDITPGTP